MSFKIGSLVTPKQGIFAGRVGMVLTLCPDGEFIEVSYLTAEGSHFIRHMLSESEFVMLEE